MATSSPTRSYKEGILLKRARGLHRKGALKWQERYCRLSNVSLDYFDPKKMNEAKGQFKVEQIQIVEVVSNRLFDKLKANAFQIGDCSEVMYFATKTPQERQEWMEAFKQASKDKHVKSLSRYHPGVYSLTNKDRWSCCGRALRESEGCSDSTVERSRTQTIPIDLDKSSPLLAGALKKDELSSSFNSVTSNSTLTEQEDINPMKRTYTSVGQEMKRPSISRQRRLEIKSVAGILEYPSNETPSTTPTGQATLIGTTSDCCDNVSTTATLGCNSTIIPPLIEDLTRNSGSTSPAPSTDSGRGTGTTSRPSSMPNSEGDFVPPLTPQSTRSHVTTITTDSDQTRSIGGGSEGPDTIRRKPDTYSILSDISGLSGYSNTLPHLRRINRARPQSMVRDGFSVLDMSITSIESTPVEIVLMRLHQACKDGNLGIVRDELDTGAPVGDQEIFNGVPMLPLFISFLHDHRHVMVYLLEHGADPNALDMTTRSCLLHWACQKGCLEAVKILVNFKADVNMRNHEDNTPLCEASKNGHTEVVDSLLESAAMVDFEGSLNHTPLHFASMGGHTEIVKKLLSYNANPMKKNSKKETAYHLAFLNNKTDVMDMLAASLPVSVRPYALLGTYQSENEQLVTSVSFIGTGDKEIKLAAGSRDCMTRVFSIDPSEGLTISSELQLANTILSVAGHAPYLAMGSAFIQVADVMSDSGWRRTVADDANEDESLEDPPLHIVSFTSDGLLVSAGVESNCVKVWPTISDKSVISQPLKVFRVIEKENEEGSIYRLVTSSAPDSSWLGMVVQPGPLLSPSANKKVFIYNLKEEKIYHIIDTGHGGLLVGAHIAFSHDGNHFIIACKDKLTKWSTTTGDKVMTITMLKDEITCVAASPDGRHIAVGLESGDTHVLDSESGMLVFPLRYKNDTSPVSSLTYSKCNSFLATGHQRGSIQLYKVAVDTCTLA